MTMHRYKDVFDLEICAAELNVGDRFYLKWPFDNKGWCQCRFVVIKTQVKKHDMVYADVAKKCSDHCHHMMHDVMILPESLVILDDDQNS